MKLFLISQDINNDYDTFSEAVVCAENEERAKYIHPRYDHGKWNGKDDVNEEWCDVKYVVVEYIGEAKKGLEDGEVVCASYHAG